MHYTDTGSGTAVVLLHAYPLDSRMWDGVRDALAEQHRLITPDQCGLGRSPLPEAVPSVDVVAAEVLGVLDELGVRRAVFGGCSMGGYVAMAVVRVAPERVAGLLLVDTKAVADAPQAAANRLAIADRAEAEGVEGWLADTMVPALLSPTGVDRVGQLVRGLIDVQPPAGVAWAQRAMAARPDSTGMLRAAGVPALVVTGAADTLIPVAAAIELAEVFGTEPVVIDDAAHLPPVEQPVRFVEAVGPWLAGLV